MKRSQQGLRVVLSAMAAVAVAATVYKQSCRGADKNGPSAAAFAFVQAGQRNDKHAAFALLAPRTRRYLDEAAKKMTAMAGAAKRFVGMDLLKLSPEAAPSGNLKFFLRSQLENRAEIEIRSAEGQKSVLFLEKTAGKWLVQLPLQAHDTQPSP